MVHFRVEQALDFLLKIRETADDPLAKHDISLGDDGLPLCVKIGPCLPGGIGGEACDFVRQEVPVCGKERVAVAFGKGGEVEVEVADVFLQTVLIPSMVMLVDLSLKGLEAFRRRDVRGDSGHMV